MTVPSSCVRGKQRVCGYLTHEKYLERFPAVSICWAAEGIVIACTQLRRVAATTVAIRVVQEVGTIPGDEVRPRLRRLSSSRRLGTYATAILIRLHAPS